MLKVLRLKEILSLECTYVQTWVNTTRPYTTTTNNQSCIGWKHPTTTSGVGCFGVHYNTTFKNVVVGLVLVGTKNYNFVK